MDDSEAKRTRTETRSTRRWLVMWSRGRRVGSVRLTPHNRRILRQLFAAYLARRDHSGTEHWALVRRPSRREVAGESFD